jgi:nitrite reductase (NO-forming)
MGSVTPQVPKGSRWSGLGYLIPITVLLLWLGGTLAFILYLPRTQSAAPGVAQPAAAPAATGHDLGAPVLSKEISRAATDVPAAITRTAPTTVRYDLTTQEVVAPLADGSTYHYWTFDGTVPGPMLRVMQGDTVEIHISNPSASAVPHSIDLHAVSGPGGGSTWTQTVPGAATSFSFKALNPGLFIYHCATPPAAAHVANGMFGMILVEPPGGLPKVDREFYVMQSEIYTQEPAGSKGDLHFSPTALNAVVGEKVRIFFGVGTFKPSNFHVIGGIFDDVYPDGGIGGPLEYNVGLVAVPAGGTTIAELTFKVPGTYLIVDHSLNRTSLGALAQIVVVGDAVPGVDVGPAG